MTELIVRICLLIAVALNYVAGNYLTKCPGLAGPGCFFNGTMYNDGAYLMYDCIGLRCEGSNWVPTGNTNPLCGKCKVYLDPHIETSDGYYYNGVQSACNYSLVQEGTSYHPDVAVFAKFRECNGVASCVGSTFFRDGPEVIVEIGRNGLQVPDIYKVYLDDNPYTIPEGTVGRVLWSSVLAWRFGDSCIRLVGTSGVAMEVCAYHLCMWSHPHFAPYYGLCGFFDGTYNMTDDFMGRMNETFLLTPYFVPSFSVIWLTAEQENKKCPSVAAREAPTLCKQTDAKKAEYEEMCKSAIFGLELHGANISLAQGSVLTEACAFDLCLVSQSTEDNPVEVSAWLDGPVTDYALRLIEGEVAEKGCEYGSQNYPEGYRKERDCYFYRCKLGKWIKTNQKVPSCCMHEGHHYEHNEKIYRGCKAFICLCGTWEQTAEVNPNCCMHEGQLYHEGEVVSINCYMKICREGSWVFTGHKDPNCPPSESTQESEACDEGRGGRLIVQVAQEVNRP
ncbi:uncharacterized protein LOC119574429 [Penaeus monodon]|uniref:uncharacterized protein LOC119574429 n=1 Tax=Penaeus monodon TaxID=6687 RepID=UPI0018A741EF|nr:uncharacterized protein LOC119574429 [Penaeus monodon]